MDQTDTGKPDDILEEAREVFEVCEKAFSHNRKEAEDDFRFARLGDQWPSEIRKQREDDHRPCLTINRMPPIIRQVVNDARQNKPSISIHPVDSGADPDTANVISSLIRNIEYESRAGIAYDTAIDCACTGGFGYWRINTDYCDDTGFDQDIKIIPVPNPFSVYPDPYSTGMTSEDWNTCFVVEHLDKRAFRKKYKGAEEVDWEADGYASLSEPWMDDERIQVAEYWRRDEAVKFIIMLSPPTSGEEGESGGPLIVDLADYEKNKGLYDAIGSFPIGSPRPVKTHKVKQIILTGAEVLEENDWAGKYIPVVPVYGDDVFVDGKRHLRSLIRDAKDPARMLNFWRTSGTELVALAPKAPYIGPKGAFKTDFSKWETINQATHAFVEYDGPTPPQRQGFAGVPQGILQEALNAADDIKTVTGLHDASLGARSNETSGRAIIARQKEGDTSTFHFIDNLTRAINHSGRIILDLLPKVYSTERIVRIRGENGKSNRVPLNQPFAKGPDGQPITQVAGQPLQPGANTIVDHETGETAVIIARMHDLSAGKYDLTVEAGPSYTTKREEAANQILAMIQAQPDLAMILGDILARNLDWEGAEEISARIKAMLPPQIQALLKEEDPDDGSGAPAAPGGPPGAPPGQPAIPPELQQALQQAGQMIQTLQQQVQTLQQRRDLEQQKMQIDGYKAETDRIEASAKVAEATRPQPVPNLSQPAANRLV